MELQEANDRFREADRLFREREYELSLELLEELEAAYPTHHRVLNAKARALAQLGRIEEAIALCDRLMKEFAYTKILPYRAQLIQQQEVLKAAEEERERQEQARIQALEAEREVEAKEEAKKPRFRLKPVRLLLLVLVLVAMYRGVVPYWLGIGAIGAYFAVRLAIKMILFRLFMLPFKMKGRALEGAMAVIHGVTPGEAPAKTAGQDEEEPKHGPLRYVWVDVTITPLPRSNGFTHWEPGELALAPAARKIKSLDDHDHCFHVSQVRVFDEGKEVADEGYKYSGPQRLKLLVGLPETQSEFQFVYYMEAFGKLWVERT